MPATGVNNDMARQYNLSQKAMDGLIGEILVAQKAEELGYRVSDEEVSQEIMGNPYFQKNGVFDKEAYMNMVKFTLNTNVTAYEHRGPPGEYRTGRTRARRCLN